MRSSLLFCVFFAACSPAEPKQAEPPRLDGADITACDAFFQEPRDDHDKARKADAALRVVEEGSQRSGISVWAGPLTGAQADLLMTAGCAHFDGMTLDEILAPEQLATPPARP